MELSKVDRLEREVSHWKSLAETYKANLEACQEELEEFQSSSRELEAEMEAQIDQYEKRVKDLSGTAQRQQLELESLRERYNELQRDSRERIQRLETDLETTTCERDEERRYIRELEQLNDDLDRAKRALVASLEDFEKRMNETIERNAFLESELDEKDNLLVKVQRLKEETRDLKQELTVRDLQGIATKKAHYERTSNLEASPNPARSKHTQSMNGAIPLSRSVAFSESDAHSADNRSSSSQVLPRSRTVDEEALSNDTKKSSAGPGRSAPFSPSARISALNIVGDLLRRVGALESKLSSYKKHTNDSSTPNAHISQKVGNRKRSTDPVNED